MKKRFTEARIIGLLREAEAGLPIKEVPLAKSNNQETAQSTVPSPWLPAESALHHTEHCRDLRFKESSQHQSLCCR
ncbi:hypothetical protein Bpla01_68140 [Burkholderia plantarii]|nr:hypothetical protein Bpla01_68140 [Burkholderia plantarii]